MSYFEDRIYTELGITKKQNKINLIDINPTIDRERTAPFEIFYPDRDDNICIRVYNLKREIIYYLDKKNDNPLSTQNKHKPYVLKRLKTPKEYTDKNGKKQYKKYDIPAGAGTFPFITPGIITKFEKKEEIKTLILTEGYFKSYKGFLHGLDIIGLSSITHYKEKETNLMYHDILQVIEVCKVKNVIILYDGDCRNISLSALENKEDLILRPSIFLSSIQKVAELLKDSDVSIYFASILSDQIPENPKGLDDLYIQFKNRENDITEDLSSLSPMPRYFQRIDVTSNCNKVYKWFHVNEVDDFYKFHQEHIKEAEFVYRGTKYKYNTQKNTCEIIVPNSVLEYFQVGDNYYKFVKVPNKYKNIETRISTRNLKTIERLIGKNFSKHIPYYEEFCNVPEHINYTQVINNCFNLYSKFEHEPEEGECDTILEFLTHIFGIQYEMGLDYIQLLYQQPWQRLPILCLVSRENQTGKSTLINLLQNIFSSNCIVVGNDDLGNQFNYSWAGKLLICCEESFIEKKSIVEKIKALSTQDKVLMNRKGKDHSEIDFFGKFILASNNEDNFIYASKHDERYWVIKVNSITKRDPNLLTKMIQEIPAFLFYLNERKLSTANEDRMWFKPEIRQTDALKKLIDANKSFLESEITYYLKETFLQFGYEYILLSPEVIRREILGNKNLTVKYISNKLKEYFPNVDVFRNPDKVPVTHRFYLPRFDNSENKKLQVNQSMVFVGRPLIFHAKDFLSFEEIKQTSNLGLTTNDFSNQNDRLEF